MKKSMILLFVLISIFAKAQFSLQPRVGLNENKHFVVAMDIAYRLGCIEPAVTINDVQHSTEPAFFSFRLGFIVPVNERTKIMAIGGNYYHYESNDKLNENYWLFGGGLRLEKYLDCMVEGKAVFIQAEYIGQFQLTIGVKI